MLLYDFINDEYNKIKLFGDTNLIKDKTFFITGTNGLIGCNLVNYLHMLNNKNNLNIKIIAHSFSQPIAWLPKSENISYIASDLNEEIPDITYDYLIHAATYGQPKKFVENKLGTVKLNTQTYISLLEQCKKSNAKVLFISSSEIYGEIPCNKIPASENFNGNVNPISDRAVYAESKRIAETISNIYYKDGLDIKVVRLAVAYGVGVKLSDSRFINEFIKRALCDNELKILDSGDARRCFCFITDMIEMILNVLLFGQEFLYNLSGPYNNSIKDIAEIIANIINIPVISSDASQKIEGTPNQIILDNNKYCEEFSKTDFISLEKGIEKTIQWIQHLTHTNQKEKTCGNYRKT